MDQPTLYLMLGYPGAGKTTTADLISELTGAVHLSSDQLRVHMFEKPLFTTTEHASVYNTLDYLTERLLQKGVSVVYDANLNHYQHRAEKYALAARVNAKPLVIWVRTGIDLARRRATELSDANPKRPYGNLDLYVFERLVKEIEPPRNGEHAIEIDGTMVSAELLEQALKTV